MANVIVNDTNLKNIANAIREQNGETTGYKPSEMAAAILAIEGGGGGGYMPTAEDLTFNVSTTSPFTNNGLPWILREYGKNPGLTFASPSQNSNQLFYQIQAEIFDAKIIFNQNAAYMPVKYLFSGSNNLKDITGTFRFPNNYNNYARVDTAEYMFGGCTMLNHINDDLIDSSFCHWFNRTGSSYNRMNTAFYNCHSLREIPRFYFEMIGTNTNGDQPCIYSATYGYTDMFNCCYALNKIEGLPVVLGLVGEATITSNMFRDTFNRCYNLSKLTFQTKPDGSPLTANWTSQVIDLTAGCTNKTLVNDEMRISGGIGVGFDSSFLFAYNSGIDRNNEAGYYTGQVYVEDTINDYYNSDYMYSKYGHTEAVETINSLPDTSVAGGGNTIKFAGIVGVRTDYLKGRTSDKKFDSRIDNLTETEIAVATAKGWTVSIV